MRIDIAAQTDVGRRKGNNEDAYGVCREGDRNLKLFREGAVLCVADGLGGHMGGEIASKLAVSVFKDIIKQSPPPPSESEEDEGLLPLIRSQILAANQAIFHTNQDLVKSGKPMGTTLLVAIVTPRKVYIGNVGDSRIYHIRDGEIIAKTEDHSWVDEQVKQGLMSKAEAEADGRRNIVTRSIGTHPDVGIDTYTWYPVPGDMLLLCTDGLINMAKDSEIAAEFKKWGGPAEITHRLVALANDNGGKDNITVIVAHISPNLLTMLRSRFITLWRKRGLHLIWLFITLVMSAGCFFAGYYFGAGGFWPK